LFLLKLAFFEIKKTGERTYFTSLAIHCLLIYSQTRCEHDEHILDALIQRRATGRRMRTEVQDERH